LSPAPDFCHNFDEMNSHLKGMVALVTGAPRGIGRAIAQRLSRDGAAVVINYARNADDARKLAGEIEAAAGRALGVQADVARVAEVIRLFDEAIACFGKLDILVNNAGLMVTKPVSAMTEEEFDRIFAVNVKGTFFAASRRPRAWPTADAPSTSPARRRRG
jgi:3-oxoacyl-[acyl-carrier protein] reductase